MGCGPGCLNQARDKETRGHRLTDEPMCLRLLDDRAVVRDELCTVRGKAWQKVMSRGVARAYDQWRKAQIDQAMSVVAQCLLWVVVELLDGGGLDVDNAGEQPFEQCAEQGGLVGKVPIHRGDADASLARDLFKSATVGAVGKHGARRSKNGFSTPEGICTHTWDPFIWTEFAHRL